MTTERLEGAEVVCDCDECHGSGDSWYVKGVDEPCRSCKGSGEGIATKRVAPGTLTEAHLNLAAAAIRCAVAEEMCEAHPHRPFGDGPDGEDSPEAIAAEAESRAAYTAYGAALRTARGEG